MPSRFRNAALLHNPLAGTRRGRRRRELVRACELLEAYGIGVTLMPTTGPGSARELAARAVAEGRDLVIVCGGDGTINEAVNGLAGSPVPLAILPAGTANVLAKELGLPWDIWRAAEYIPCGTVRRIALGRAGKRAFICVGGAGADGNIVHHLGQRSHRHQGMLSYWLESFRQLFLYRFPEFTVEVGGERLRTTLLVVSRTRSYGGPVVITPRASLLADDFELCLFPRRFRLVYLGYFLAQLVGQLERFPAVQFRNARKLTACAEGDARIYVQVDGEPAGVLPVEFSVVPDALSLLVPEGFADRYAGGA